MNDLTPNQDFDKQTSKINNKSIKMATERVKINKAEVVALLEKGITKSEVRDTLYAGLNDAQWKKALQQMGLSSYKVKKIDFVIEDFDTVTGDGNQYAPTGQVDNKLDIGQA